MYVPDFDYYSPSTLEEACGVLGGLGEGARVLAGGTDLLHMMKNELLAPKALVSLKNIRNLGEIKYDPGKGVVLGARATHNDLVNSLLLQQKYPAVPETAHQMANNQVRNLGTVGGNLVNAVPSADLPPILIALRAYVNLVSPRGKRTMDLEDFFLGPRKTAIGRDEILTSVVIPDQPSTGSWYCKFGLRRSGALAVVGVAVSVVADGLHVQSGRIVLGAVYPTPLRAKEAERLLAGGIATEALLEEVGRAAAAECRPISDTRASDEYRRDMVRVFTKRALRKALKIEGATTEGGNGNGIHAG